MTELSRSNEQDAREAMSALADGQADAAAATALWGSDASAREAWHTYHVIGDVLRSEDLVGSCGRDGEFLSRIRARLAQEPAIVAPSPPHVAGPRRWVAPAAVAAGFVVVAGALVVSRMVSPPGQAGPVLAAAPAASAMPAAQAVAPAGITTVAAGQGAVGGKLIRDAGLDAYLRAHRGGPAAVPGGAIGRFETVVLER